MKYISIIVGIVVVAGGAYAVFFKDASVETKVTEEQMEVLPPASEPELQLDIYTVQDGDTFATILEEWGIEYDTMFEILNSASSTYDFTKVRIGRTLRYTIQDGILEYLEYDVDTEDMVIVEYENKTYVARTEPIEYEVEQVIERGVIDSSLFAAATEAGVAEETVVKVAEMVWLAVTLGNV